MEEEMGLAATARSNNELIAEVVRLLLDGVPPEQLLAQGVPQEVLQEAMEIVLSQAPAGGAPMPNAASAIPATEAGLAATGIQ